MATGRRGRTAVPATCRSGAGCKAHPAAHRHPALQPSAHVALRARTSDCRLRRSLADGRCGSSGDREQIHMSLYQRARDILAAKANKAIDAAEKPDELLDLSYQDLRDRRLMLTP